MTNIVSFPSQNSNAFDVFEDSRGTPIFNVDNLNLHTEEHGTISGRRGLFVEDRCINVVSDSYEVHQPIEVYQQFYSAAKTHGLEVNKCLVNPHNGGMLLSAKYSNLKVLGDDHDVNLTFYTSHCGRYKTFLTLDMLRMACMNQVPVLYRDQSRFIFSEKHYKNALDISLLGKFLEAIPGSIESHTGKMDVLSQVKFTEETFLEWAVEFYKMNKEAKQFQTKVDKMRAIYNNAPGQRIMPNSAYKAYGAITYLNTHGGRETKMKHENIITKSSNDSLKAMDSLLQAA